MGAHEKETVKISARIEHSPSKCSDALQRGPGF
jgi:hypothetical protein